MKTESKSAGESLAAMGELLRSALATAESLPRALGQLDAARLLAVATEREALQVRFVSLQQSLESTLAALPLPRPREIASAIEEVQALGRALQQQDQTNALLAGRSMEVLGALRRQLAPEGYDRRGQRVAASLPTVKRSA